MESFTDVPNDGLERTPAERPGRAHHELLGLLARTAGLDPSPHAVEERLEDAWRQQPAGTAWVRPLLRAGQGLGMTLTPLERSPEEIFRKGGRQGPLATLVQADDGPQWLLVEGWAGALVRVRSGRRPEEPQWVDLPTLTAMAGSENARQPLTWALAEPNLPMQALGSGGHDTPPPLSRLRELIRLEKDDLWVVVVYAIGVGLFALATPITVQALVNTVAFGALVQPLVILSLLLLAALGLAGALRAMKAWVVEVLQERLFVRTAGDLGYRLPRVQAQAYASAHGPELVNRFLDVVTLQKSASTLLLDGVSTVLQAGIGMLLLAFYHPYLLAFDVVLLAIVAGIVFGYATDATYTALKESKAKYKVLAWLQELARHPLTFRHESGMDYALRHTDELSRSWLEMRRKHWKYLFRQIVGAIALQAVASALLLFIGGFLVMNGQLTLGQLVAAELIVSSVLLAFTKFGKHLESYYDMAAALDKLGTLVDLPLEPESGESTPPSRGPAGLELREVSFTHADGRQVLEGINLSIRPGAKVAVAARCAAGKSALANLLYGLYPPAAGTVQLDGVHLKDVRALSLRRDVAVVRGAEVFAGTLADNVRLDRMEVSLGEVRRVLERVGLTEALSRLPHGLQSELVTGGAPLSRGEALLVTLARALLVPPRLLIVDGALDGMDDAHRRHVMELLLAPETAFTLVLLTGREDLLDQGQERFVLSEGRLLSAPARTRLTLKS